MTFETVGREMVDRHALSYSNRECDTLVLRNPGFYHWRSGGEKHMNDPSSIADLQVCYLCKIVCGFYTIIPT